jgi:hypothetical protein
LGTHCENKNKNKRVERPGLPPEQEWYYDDEAKVHYYEDGHYWFESRSVDVCQPIEDTPLGNTDIQFTMEIVDCAKLGSLVVTNITGGNDTGDKLRKINIFFQIVRSEANF